MSNIWTVLEVVHHEDGGATVTMRNDDSGNVLTEDYPPGSVLLRTMKREGL